MHWVQFLTSCRTGLCRPHGCGTRETLPGSPRETPGHSRGSDKAPPRTRMAVACSLSSALGTAEARPWKLCPLRLPLPTAWSGSLGAGRCRRRGRGYRAWGASPEQLREGLAGEQERVPGHTSPHARCSQAERAHGPKPRGMMGTANALGAPQYPFPTSFRIACALWASP